MRSLRPQGAVLCSYEAVRLFSLTGAFVQSQAAAALPFPVLPLITPGALFFLMSLFWLLDAPRYRAYGPLFAVGKGLGVVTAVSWLLLTDGSVLREFLVGPGRFFVPAVVFFLIPGDVLSAWLAMRIMRR